MKLRVLRYTLLLSALFGVSLLLWASLPTVATGTWVAAGNLSAARSGACTVALSDGRLLISGGADANGPTATADLFSTTGSWSAAASMNSPRSHQSCAVLQDGRVLVAGGTTSGGGITNSTEMYDPSADSWAQAGVMNDARSGATASVLQDGRVLIAGGQSSGGALNTLEIFDPNSGTFSNAGTMSSPRQDHAAAVLSDGRVLIAGGSSDGANALNTTEIYDPQAGSVSAGPPMSTPRARHTATTLLDGTVVVIGGSDYTNDLASAEFFDPAANNFNAASSLATARSKHSAFLLPNNNEVLVVGGQSVGADLASAELYVPWQKAFQATGAMATPRSDATGAALTKVNGRLLIAGGSSPSAELYGFATVKTDAADYAPGTIVNITGSGWQPGETVTLTLVESPLIDTPPTMTAVADGNGNILNNQFSPDSYDVNVRFYLTAVGQTSAFQAQNTFTDGSKDSFDVSGGPYNLTLNPGDAIPAGKTFTYTISSGTTNHVTFPVTMTVALTGAFGSVSPTSGSISGYSGSGVTATVSGTVPCTQGAGPVTLNVVGTATSSTSNLSPDHRNSTVNITVTSTPGPSCDTTPPTTTITLNPAAPNGSNGWYTSNVHVTVSATDNVGGTGVAETRCVLDPASPPASFDAIPAGCAYTAAGADVTTDGQHTIYAASKDNAGNKETPKSSSINIDKTPPTITFGGQSPAANGKGWNNSDVTLSWTCTDSLSGPVSSTVTQVISTEGAGQSATGTCTDKAGNTASHTDGNVNLDKTPPTLTGSRSPAANTNGWNNSDVTVTFTCNDSLSGVDTPPLSPQVVTTEGANQFRNAGCTDKAGNSASATVSPINIDKTPPTLTATVTPTSPASTGWYNHTTGAPKITFACSDSLSGVSGACPAEIDPTDGGNQSFTRTISDLAGNNTSVNVGPLNVDTTPPTITITAPGIGGYLLNQAVASNYSCTDATSGVATCAGTVASGANFSTNPVAGHSFTVNATDVAGNTATLTNNYTVTYATAGGICLGDVGHTILQPINADGSSVFNGKSTSPAKFRVCDANGISIGTAGVVSNFVIYQVVGGTVVPTVDEQVYSTTPDTAFRWDPTGLQWIFNINNKSYQSNQTYFFRISLNDGSSILFDYGLK